MALKSLNLMSILSSLAPEVWVLSEQRIRNRLGINKKKEGTNKSVPGMPSWC